LEVENKAKVVIREGKCNENATSYWRWRTRQRLVIREIKCPLIGDREQGEG
jgi:hypothetical protein